MNDWKIEENDAEVIIKIPKEKKYTVGELKQKLINDLMNENTISSDQQTEINLLKIILDYENNNLKIVSNYENNNNHCKKT